MAQLVFWLGYWLKNQRIRIRFPTVVWYFSLPTQCPDRLQSDTHQDCLGVKRAECGVGHHLYVTGRLRICLYAAEIN
jgi:hypothetical protein